MSHRYDRTFVGSAGGATPGRRCFDRSARICTRQGRQLDLRPLGAPEVTNRLHRNPLTDTVRMSSGPFSWPAAPPSALSLQAAWRRIADRRRAPFPGHSTCPRTSGRRASIHGLMFSYLWFPQLMQAALGDIPARRIAWRAWCWGIGHDGSFARSQSRLRSSSACAMSSLRRGS